MQTDLCIVIPAYQPAQTLPQYVRDLRRALDCCVLVVDDGSDGACRPWFDEAERIPGCRVLRHEHNRGKGAALKTAFQWLRTQQGLQSIITADCDGQHSVRDVMRVAEQCREHSGALVLGCRTFGEGTPRRSMVGNRVTARAMKLLYNIDLEDTQTGLRGIPASMLEPLCTLRGERYEYELNMLILAHSLAVPMVKVPIETLYFDNNAGSHYRPVRDSLRVTGQLLRGLGQYGLSSVLSAAADVFVYALLVKWALAGLPQSARILCAAVLARLLSSVVNYALNRRLPYVQTREIRQTAVRYYILLTVQLVCSVSGAWLLTALGVDELAAKWATDLLLAAGSYQVQLHWVFAKAGENS